jgi:hypothetical protein
MQSNPHGPLCPAPASELHARFLAILPRIEQHARIYFRHIRCPTQKEEVLAEVRGLVWKWFVRLVRRGKDVDAFVSTIASYATRAVGSGRRVCGQEKAKDAMSSFAQRKHGFAIGTLLEAASLSDNPLAEALQDNTVSSVPEQVAFRLDFPAWRRTRSDRDRRIIDRMIVGERTATLARLFGVSAARVSQMRREFHDDWHAYCGEPIAVG